jgi:pimeloyl-ACP methyl ester carboxylesterase
VRIGRQELECRWWGDPSSPSEPLVLLHEGLGSVSRWRDFPAALAARTGRRVFAYSRWGHGRSDPPLLPHDVTFMHEEAKMLSSILDAAAIRRCIVFGHSDGASIGLIFASANPARVEGLILEAPHVFVEEISIRGVKDTAARFASGDLAVRMARHHRRVDIAFAGWRDVWLHPDFRRWNIEEYLPEIGCPVLLIQGEADEYGTLRQVDAIASQVAGRVERLVLPECGHSPHRDRPNEVLSAVTAFVQSLD